MGINKKQRTLKAIKEIILKYQNPEKYRNKYFRTQDCPLCKIHMNFKIFTCYGCPLTNKEGNQGCWRFNSYKVLTNYINKKSLQKRIEFYEELYKVCEKEPPEQFTKKGWKFLDIGYEK